MRNYQTLTLIGSILGILIAFAVIGLLGVLDIGITSFENLTDSTSGAARRTKKRNDQQTFNIFILLAVFRLFSTSLQ